MKTLYLEWISYMNSYRVYDPSKPQSTVAYVDSIEEAEKNHPEYNYCLCDNETMHVECY